eukprot:894147_1
MGKKNLLDYFTPQKGKKRKQSGKTKKRKETKDVVNTLLPSSHYDDKEVFDSVEVTSDLDDMVHQYLSTVGTYLPYSPNGPSLCHAISYIGNLALVTELRVALKKSSNHLLQCLDLLLSVFTFAMREGIKSSNTGDIWKCFIHCLTIYCKAYNLLGARGIRQDMAVLEKDLMDLDIFNVTRKAMQICANCATQSEQRVTRSCAYNVTYPLDSGTIQLIQKMDYFNDEECTSCGERSVLMATALDTQKWFQVYLDQHCYDSFDIKRLTTMDVMQSDGLCKTYKLKAVTVLDNGHYWMNSHDHSDGEFYEWESLSARIGPLTRIRTISGPTIAVLLFKEAPISLKNHRLIVVGFIRCESCNEIYPDVIDLVIKYSYEYPFKLRNGLELSSAMFGKAKADGSGLEHYLKKWKDTMHA